MTATSDAVLAEQQAANGAVAPHDPDRGRAVTSAQVRRAVGVLVAAAAVALFGVVGSNEWVSVMNTVFLTCIGALALNLLLGHTGLVSIGNAAFLSIGAVAAAQIAAQHHGPFWLALVVGTLASALAGLLLALPAARIKGLYLAMATLAFHFIVNSGVLKLQTKQVGPAGYRLPKASLFGYVIRSQRIWYVVLAVSAALTLLLVRTLLIRKPGRAWRAIREEQAMAAMSGVAVWRYKVWAFVISSALVGFAGVLSAYYIGVISSETFDLHLAVLYLAYVIIGGMGSMYGPIAGSLFLVSLPHIIEKTRSGIGLGAGDAHVFLIQDAAIGAAVVLMILVEPLGLARLIGRAAAFVGRLVRRRRPGAVPQSRGT